jgi:Flp pilus assembly protein TadG
MTLLAKFRHAAGFRALRRILGEARGSELLELALVLPLLLMVVIGVTDFGTAFLARQRVNSAAMEGARVAASQTMGGLYGNAVPQSILDARTAVTSALTGAGMSACGLDTASVTEPSVNTLAYQFTGSAVAGCPNGSSAVLLFTRGSTWTTTGAIVVQVEGTQVQLTYPVTWKLNQIVPGGALPLPATVTVNVQQSNLS